MGKYIKTDIVDANPQVKSFIQSITVNGRPDYTTVEHDGYIVIDKDNNKNWIQKDAFETSYRPAENMGIGLVVEALRNGFQVSREIWTGSIHLELILREDGRHWIGMRIGEELERWFPLSSDILAEDYYIIDEDVDNLRDQWLSAGTDESKKNL